MRALYTIGIWFYTLGVRIAALFGHEKARQMVHGWKQLPHPLPNMNRNKCAWFHASSLGEFEQARPVLEKYKHSHPNSNIVVTFFSPSGYEVRKNYAQADAVLYLPPDLPCSVNRFLKTYRPTVAFFVKYDFWFNYLNALSKANIPTYIFSVIFRPEQYFFKPWGRWFMRQIKECYTHIFVQNEESLKLLRSHGVKHCSMAGDTRFDRVYQIAAAAEHDEVTERWLEQTNTPLPPSMGDEEGNIPSEQCKVLVCGSTWPPDEELIAKLKAENRKLKVILAPHVISEEHLKQIERLFPDSVRYSSLTSSTRDTRETSTTRKTSTLIIDNIGILSKLYRYADVAYIGGGFGAGIHNILEAVTFGKPVLFGPNYHKFKEAHDIIARGGGFSHADADSLRRNLKPLLTDDKAYRRASEACLEYMHENLGSTDKILSTIVK